MKVGLVAQPGSQISVIYKQDVLYCMCMCGFSRGCSDWHFLPTDTNHQFLKMILMIPIYLQISMFQVVFHKNMI